MYTKLISELPREASFVALTSDYISEINAKFTDLYGVGLPSDYLDLLCLSNGLSYNGYSIFGVYDSDYLKDNSYMKGLDLFWNNKSIRELTDISEYIILGVSDMDYVAYNITDKKYQIIGNGTIDVYGTYDRLIDLLYVFFENELNN